MLRFKRLRCVNSPKNSAGIADLLSSRYFRQAVNGNITDAAQEVDRQDNRRTPRASEQLKYYEEPHTLPLLPSD